MKITSMSNKELYRTLIGQDLFPERENKAAKPKKAATLDLSKAIAVSKYENQIQLDDEIIAKERNFDRFESSLVCKTYKMDELPFEKEAITDWSDIDFDDPYTDMVISSRSLIATMNGGTVPTKESIAKYYGEMAKRLDTAYAEGKFTKEEYDYLNDGIAERMEHSAHCAERAAAFFKSGHDRSMSLKAFEREAAMTQEELQADREAAIQDYVNRYFKIDRKFLMQLFNSIRYGK